eukprot:TRINITY_DN2751_c0_g1_i2.p1 TRINITY_DN2751_c0_g1~~TRINITY_DN2751_c0_g1_i2.p1  ORF type:complete len:366 (+),score=120.06 TRINITY_DN2751_c0_g1_i2:127-1224(+)
MSYFSEDSKTTALVVGGTAVGALALYYLWDRYSADSLTWGERRENVKESLIRTERNVEKKFDSVKENLSEKAHKVADKVTGSSSSAGKNIPNPEPTLGSQPVLTPLPTVVSTPVKPTPAAPVVEVRQTTTTTAVLTSDAMLHDPNPIINEPELKKVKEYAPVVQEVVHPVEVEEVQPVIHREIKKVEVHQITQPIYEEYTAPLREFNKENIAEHRPTLYQDVSAYSAEFERGIESGSRTYEEAKKTVVVKPAIIEEVIKTDIIEVIQPVIHRDTIEPIVVHTSQPIYEKIKEQPYIVHETRKPIILTHDDVIRLENAKGLEQLAMLETFSEQQGKGPVADYTYDDTPVKVVTEVTQTTVVTEKVL